MNRVRYGGRKFQPEIVSEFPTLSRHRAAQGERLLPRIVSNVTNLGLGDMFA